MALRSCRVEVSDISVELPGICSKGCRDSLCMITTILAATHGYANKTVLHAAKGALNCLLCCVSIQRDDDGRPRVKYESTHVLNSEAQ